MTVFRSGNLVVLKSGGPVMTVDAVNTDIFDDNKVTGIVCVWFIGGSLQRARFEQDAIEPALLQNTASRKRKARSEQVAGEYNTVLDEMVAAMNAPADAAGDGSNRAGSNKAGSNESAGRPTSAKTAVERPKTAPAPEDVAAGPSQAGSRLVSRRGLLEPANPGRSARFDRPQPPFPARSAVRDGPDQA